MNYLAFCVNCNCKPSGSEAYRVAWKMAKAQTEALYCRAYQDLYVTNQYCAEWLHARRKMFASFILIGRRGIVTTNSVEQFNRVMLEARESPITDALLILLKKIDNTIVARYEQGKKWRDNAVKIVPTAGKVFENNLRLALTKHVAVKKYPSETDRSFCNFIFGHYDFLDYIVNGLFLYITTFSHNVFFQ